MTIVLKTNFKFLATIVCRYPDLITVFLNSNVTMCLVNEKMVFFLGEVGAENLDKTFTGIQQVLSIDLLG